MNGVLAMPRIGSVLTYLRRYSGIQKGTEGIGSLMHMTHKDLTDQSLALRNTTNHSYSVPTHKKLTLTTENLDIISL
jgi:hypothetical protein